ncbi:NAD(P)-dependent dehydrogenase (short-subunit alcohol dehydrogenase family) [Kineothrix alysoides]|uniref:NAD(P)-dependent dehydrogenase (Short-subunit alcohol dehydrogenase family) n=1 Tax=Kineothrix alysoides TaxID=1469948 RepID=A0A4R1QMV2_9FIRM|nr:SDR family NAD(P)-dependent oxidoreductase [Kineothrix alysoides]TCL54111.1 NAD(P)-dependent dehydrogenase (short-subunit alcohol dehydrogenase family) [Kineothrix alysoides]
MKYVFFTGAAGGLGELCIKAISKKEEWTVFAADMNEKELIKFEEFSNVIPIKTDVTNQSDVEAARKTVLTYTDRLDAIVNFAGLIAFTSMVEGECIHTAEKLLAVNLMGMVRVNYVLFDLIYKGHGRIINCSSEAGWMTPQPFAAPYFFSKRAVEGYNDSLRRELMYLDIPVIKIQPGSFNTNLTQGVYGKYEKALSETKYYRQVLTKMKPLMELELKQNNNPAKLVKAVLRALETPKPKLSYRVGTGKLLAMLEIFPEKSVDIIYRLLLKT